MSSFANLLERVYRTVFIGLVILLPIIFIPSLWATLPHAKVGFLALMVGIGLVAFVLARFLEGVLLLPRSWVLFASLFLPVAYLGSALATGASRASLLGLGIETHTVAIMFLWSAVVILSSMVFRGRADLIRVQYALLIGASVVMVFQLLRLMFGAEFMNFGGLFSSTAASIIGSWHDLGIFLGLAAFFASTLLANPMHDISVWTRWLIRAVFALAVILLVIVNTFDVWVALGVLSFVAICYLGWKSIKRGNPARSMAMNLVPFFVLGGIALICALYGTQVHETLPERLQIEYVEVRPSWEGTFAIASQTLEGKNALFGSGPNTFGRQWGLYKPSGVNETAFWNADFLQGIGFIPTAITTIGLLAALAWILFLMSVVYESIKTFLGSAEDTQPFIAAVVGAVIYLWVLSSVYIPGVVLITFAFLFSGALVGWGMHAGTTGMYMRATSEVPRIGFVWSVSLIAVALITCIILGLILRTIIADLYVNKSIVTYNQTRDIQAAQVSLDKAFRIDGKNNKAHRAALELGILQIAALAASTSPDVEKLRAELSSTVSTAIQHGLAAVAQNGTNYQNWIALARVYEQLVGAQVEGAYENAEKAYQLAIAENPTNPFAHFRLAQLAAAKNDLEGVETHLRQALALKPNLAEALLMLTQLEFTKGNMEAAIAAGQALVRAVPEQPVAWFQLGSLFFQAERAEEAAIALQAVVLNGNYADALYLLGSSLVALNQTDDALTIFQHVLELNPGNQQVETVIKTLEDQKATTAAAKEETEDVSEEE